MCALWLAPGVMVPSKYRLAIIIVLTIQALFHLNKTMAGALQTKPLSLCWQSDNVRLLIGHWYDNPGVRFSRHWPETCLGFGHWLSIFTSSVVLWWRHCSDQMWTEVCNRLRLVSRWRIVKSKKSFVNYLLKHWWNDCSNTSIYSKFITSTHEEVFLAQILITPYILRNVDDWNTWQTENTFYFIFSCSYAFLLLVRNLTSEISFCSCSPKHAPEFPFH